MKKNIFFLYLLTFFLVCEAQAAGITASLDRTSVAEGEPFVLTIKTDEMTNSVPDLSALEKNFRLLSTSISQNHSSINGQNTTQTVFKLRLLPLKNGSLPIPPLNFAGNQSPPLQIAVLQNAAAQNVNAASANINSGNNQGLQQKNNPQYSLSTKILSPKKQYYVQQQILYQVTLSDEGGLQGGEPLFNSKEADNWLIKSMGQPQVSHRYEDGKQIRDITFTYALFAQKSGNLKIPAVTFSGSALDNNQPTAINIAGSDVFNLSFQLPSIFGVQTPVELRAPARAIKILPVPSNYTGKWWLPAENVVLKSQWLSPSLKFKKGDAVSREITLTATGVVDTQLPELTFPPVEGLKQYPEKSVSQTILVDGKLTAVQKTVVVYIPETSGQLTIPRVVVPWFNIQTGQTELSAIEAETLTVGGNLTENDLNEPLPVKVTMPELSAENTTAQFSNSGQNQNIQTAARSLFSQPQFIYMTAAAAFLLGLLVSWLIFKCHAPKGGKPKCEMRRYPDYIVQKAYQNDFRSLRDGLISWATGFYPNRQIGNLKDVMSAVGDERFSSQVEMIMSQLYGDADNSEWNPKVFADIFKSIAKKKTKIKTDVLPLPPLYR